MPGQLHRPGMLKIATAMFHLCGVHLGRECPRFTFPLIGVGRSRRPSKYSFRYRCRRLPLRCAAETRVDRFRIMCQYNLDLFFFSPMSFRFPFSPFSLFSFAFLLFSSSFSYSIFFFTFLSVPFPFLLSPRSLLFLLLIQAGSCKTSHERCLNLLGP